MKSKLGIGILLLTLIALSLGSMLRAQVGTLNPTASLPTISLTDPLAHQLSVEQTNMVWGLSETVSAPLQISNRIQYRTSVPRVPVCLMGCSSTLSVFYHPSAFYRPGNLALGSMVVYVLSQHKLRI